MMRFWKVRTKNSVPVQPKEGDRYFDEVKAVIDASVTARLSALLFADYIAGKPQEEGRRVGGVDLNDLITWAARQAAYFYGVYVLIRYNAELKAIELRMLPYEKCRICQRDDRGQYAKIEVELPSGTKVEYLAFTDNPDAFRVQLEAVDGIRNHPGHVLFFPFEQSPDYPTPLIAPALVSARTEIRSAILKENGIARGSFNTSIILTSKFNNDKEREDFSRSIARGIGENGACEIVVAEREITADALSDDFVLKDINSGFDSKILEYTDVKSEDAIRACFKNIPADLIRQSNAMFTGGENIREMKRFYQEQTARERAKLQTFVNKVLAVFGQTPITIKPITDEDDATDGREAERVEAAAAADGYAAE